MEDLDITKTGSTCQQRNSNVELLRIFLMLGVCVWHVIVHGGCFKDIGTPDYVLQGNLAFVTFMCALLSPCTYCFVFISGWYGIKFSLYKYLYFVFIAVSCYWLGILVKFLLYDYVSWGGIIRHMFPIASNAWWFLTNYVLVMLFSPFINRGFESIPQNVILCLLLIMTFIEVASFPNNGSSFYGLLYIYMLARYMRNQDFQWATRYILVCFICALLLLWGMVFLCASRESLPLQRLSFMLLGYTNPLVIIMAISGFLLVYKQKHRFSKLINEISSSVICVYLLTEVIMHVRGGYKYVYQLFINSLWQGTLLVMLIMLVGIIVGIYLSFLYKKIIKLLNISNVSI